VRCILPFFTLALIACTGETDPIPPGPPAWTVALDQDDLSGAVLSAWGAVPDQPFVVGGPLGNPGEAIAIHYDGAAWQNLAPGGTDSFWWVHGTAVDDVWMVGEHGRVSHWDGAAFTEHDIGIDATVWGVFAFARDDVWVVAGNPGGGMMEPNDIVMRWDGSDWTVETVPMPYGVAFYKIWGRSSDDLYIVGENGVIWRRDQGDWLDESVTGTGTLFTVTGCGEDVYAVGGYSVLHTLGDGLWLDLAEEMSLPEDWLSGAVNGVGCAPPADLVLAGNGGLKERLVEDGFTQEFTVRPFEDLHGAWASGDGVFWVAGGDFISPASGSKRKGVIGRYGPGTVADHL
jgi:hypothetical protein